MKAVIMAGGAGTRLRPLTCNVAKPMVPVLGKPMMEHIISLLKRHNITRIANTLWYLPDNIQGYFGDGSFWGVEMEYFIEETPLGTAGSVRNAADFLDETFVVVSGDSLTDIDLTQAVEFHRHQGALATLVLTRVKNPLSYGVVITDDEGRITQFLEKPSWSEVFSDTVNTGIYVLEPEIFQQIEKNQNVDFSKDLFPSLLRDKAPLFGYVADGYWSDVGNLAVYRQAQADCLEGRVQLDIPCPDESGLIVAESAEISPDATIEGPVYIGEEVQIESGAHIGPYTVIGPHCQVEAASSLKRCTLWKGVQVGRRCELRGTIMANHVHVGDDVKAFEGSVIGDKSELGSRCVVQPNVKIWPAKTIKSGSTLNDCVVWGEQEDRTLFTAEGISGDLRSALAPEVIVKVGLAYGAFLGKGNQVFVTADASNQGRIAKRAFISGLTAAGVDVLDGGTASGNLTRFGVQLLRAEAGFHCQRRQANENHAAIQCWDKQGKAISKADERKIQNILFGEDFPRADAKSFGRISYVPDIGKQYVDYLTRIFRDRLEGMQLRLVNSSADKTLFSLAEELLTKSGCQLVYGETPNITVQISDNEWHLIDERGNRLEQDQLWGLLILALADYNKRGKGAAIPVDVSSRLSKTARQVGLDLHWTKTDRRAWMEIASELGNTVEADQVEFYPHIEPLVTLGEILSFLNQADRSLTELEPRIGAFKASKTRLCPWDLKGQIMRKLINQANPQTSDFIDGVKHYHGENWALIIPDGDEPVFRILCEADSQEEADALAAHYLKYIDTLLAEEGVH